MLHRATDFEPISNAALMMFCATSTAPHFLRVIREDNQEAGLDVASVKQCSCSWLGLRRLPEGVARWPVLTSHLPATGRWSDNSVLVPAGMARWPPT